MLLFICYLLLTGNGPYRHGAQLVWVPFILINFGLIISGIALTIEARKRKSIFWILLGATFLACSYMGIPLLMEAVKIWERGNAF